MQCFILFFSDDSKQYSATNTAHSNRLIELFKKKLMSALSIICENTDVCVEQYRCDTAKYLMSVYTNVAPLYSIGV